MKQNIYTIYDEKGQFFLAPFTLAQDGQATRAFADAINSAEHQFSKHPEDYTLFCVAQFDDATGLVEAHSPRTLGNGVQFRETPLPDNPYENSHEAVQPRTNGEHTPDELRPEPRPQDDI